MSTSSTRGIALSLASVLFAFAGSVASAQLVNGVAAGDTTTDSTVLWARSLSLGGLSFDVSTAPNFVNATTINTTISDTLVPGRVNVTGLTPGTRYYYRASDASGASLTGTFVTAAAQGSRPAFRMGVSGDWRGDAAPFPFARNVAAQQLDLWISLGDTIYADVPSPALPGVSQARTLPEFRQKHAEIYTERGGLNTLADVRASTSTLAMIDDHEVTNDFAGFDTVANDARFAFGGAQPTDRLNNTPLYNNGLQAFHDYHPIQQRTYAPIGDARTDNRPDLYRTQRYGDTAAVFVADARSFRDVELAPVADPTNPAQIGGFLVAAANPNRTMLGSRQFQRLTSDLLAAQQSGVTWKFVNIGQPSQNLGVLGAEDRYEGYAAERAALLNFVKTNRIENVVFVTADIHGTLVNNLTYQTTPGGPQIDSGVWEISTGSGAYDAPFGPTVAGIAAQLNLPGALPLATYLDLPAAFQEQYVQGLVNAQLVPLGYDTLGLAGSSIPATLLQGTWTATNTYGWTQFDIDPVTQALLVTTYGIPWYPVGTDPAFLATLQPTIVQQFRVNAIPGPSVLGVLGLAGLVGLRRRR